MNPDYSLIVFDWDGTLMDSAARIVQCMRLAASDVGLSVPTPAAARDIIGLGLDDAVARLFPGIGRGDLESLVSAYRYHWLGDRVVAAEMFAGALTLIEALHRQGLLLGVATGKSRLGLDKALEESRLGGFFHATRCADETFSKPHPQMLEEILTDLDTAPDRALVVGDTEYDMQMAANAGVRAVGMSHGVHSKERLLGNGALQCFDDLAALGEWLLGPSSSRRIS
jgi:phosphoglycolate phosphatase